MLLCERNFSSMKFLSGWLPALCSCFKLLLLSFIEAFMFDPCPLVFWYFTLPMKALKVSFIGNILEYVESQAWVCIAGGFHLSKIQPQKLLGLADLLRSHLHPSQKKHVTNGLAPKTIRHEMFNFSHLVTNGSLFVCWLFRRA